MARPRLNTQAPENSQQRIVQQQAVERSLIELPAFGLTLIAASVKKTEDPNTAYSNYQLPTDTAELAFTLKGALRLEMMNLGNDQQKAYRRLWGSNSRGPDLHAWASRVYVEAFQDGKTAAAQLENFCLPQQTEIDKTVKLKRILSGVTRPVVFLQVNDLYISDEPEKLFSTMLGDFIETASRLLSYVGKLYVLPVGRGKTE